MVRRRWRIQRSCSVICDTGGPDYPRTARYCLQSVAGKLVAIIPRKAPCRRIELVNRWAVLPRSSLVGVRLAFLRRIWRFFAGLRWHSLPASLTYQVGQQMGGFANIEPRWSSDGVLGAVGGDQGPVVGEVLRIGVEELDRHGISSLTRKYIHPYTITNWPEISRDKSTTLLSWGGCDKEWLRRPPGMLWELIGTSRRRLARTFHRVPPATHITLHTNRLCFIPSKAACSVRSTTTPFAGSWTFHPCYRLCDKNTRLANAPG